MFQNDPQGPPVDNGTKVGSGSGTSNTGGK